MQQNMGMTSSVTVPYTNRCIRNLEALIVLLKYGAKVNEKDSVSNVTMHAVC